MTFCPSSKTSIPPFFWIAITRFSTLPRLTGADTLLFWKCTHFVCGPCTIAHYISVKPLLFHLLPPPLPPLQEKYTICHRYYMVGFFALPWVSYVASLPRPSSSVRLASAV